MTCTISCINGSPCSFAKSAFDSDVASIAMLRRHFTTVAAYASLASALRSFGKSAIVGGALSMDKKPSFVTLSSSSASRDSSKTVIRTIVSSQGASGTTSPNPAISWKFTN
jgi:hypothetical protein